MTRGRVGHSGRTGRYGVGLVSLLAVAGLVGCTDPDPVQPTDDAVVVAASAPFVSLNGALPEGSAVGSRLVQGAVLDGFTRLDAAGQVVDGTLGTVEKVADSPLTVRYTIADGASWSDGTPVSPVDLLLEWAARSGRFDEAVVPQPDPSGEAAPTPTASATSGTDGTDGTDADDTAGAADVVRFGATSAALLHASAFPTIDGATVTLVYDTPVADWRTALDLNLPAHVVGRVALAPDEQEQDGSPAASSSASGPSGTATAVEPSAPSEATESAGPTATASAEPGTDWAAAVRAALESDDHAALVAISDAWRTGFGAEALAADPSRAVTSGPYAIAEVVPGEQVELVRDEHHTAAPARHDRVVVRSDLTPLDAVDGLGDGSVDVLTTDAQADVLDAVDAVDGATVTTGGGRVLQLVTQVAGGGVFDPAAHGGDAAVALAVRQAFQLAVPRAALAEDVAAVDPAAEVSDAVLVAVGPESTAGAAAVPAEDVAAAASALTATGLELPVTVRLLVVGGQARDPLVERIVGAAGEAGFDVQVVNGADTVRTAWDEPGEWDVALVPGAQAADPVATVVETWRSGGSVNLAGLADTELDGLLDAAAAQVDPVQGAQALDAAATRLVGLGVVLPLVRMPGLSATAPDAEVAGVQPVDAGAVDLASWWSWAVTTPDA